MRERDSELRAVEGKLEGKEKRNGSTQAEGASKLGKGKAKAKAKGKGKAKRRGREE